MQDTIKMKFEEYSKEYWSNAVNVFTSSIEAICNHYAKLNAAEAILQKGPIAGEIYKSYSTFIKKTQHIAAEAKRANLGAKETINIVNKNLVSAFESIY